MFKTFIIALIILIIYYLYKSSNLIETYQKNCSFINIKQLSQKEQENLIESIRDYVNKELSLHNSVEFHNLSIKNLNSMELVEMDISNNCFIQGCDKKCVCELYRSFDNSRIISVKGGNIKVKNIQDTKLEVNILNGLKVKVPFELIMKGVTAKIETNCSDKVIIRDLNYDSIELVQPAHNSIVGKFINSIPKEKILNSIKSDVIDKEIQLHNKPEIKHLCMA